MTLKLARVAPTLLRLAVAAALVTSVVSFRSHPVVSFVTFAVGSLAAAGALFTRRNMKALARAALANDLDALAALASGPELNARLFGQLALAHHGRYLSEERVFPCTCGTCEKDALEEEIDVARRLTRLVWTGRAADVVKLAGGRVREQGTNGALSALLHASILPYRGATLALAVALDPAEIEGIDGAELAMEVAKSLPLVKWPLTLAAAKRRARDGHLEAARQLLAGMPAWPKGSPLETERQAVTAIVEGSVGSSRRTS